MKLIEETVCYEKEIQLFQRFNPRPLVQPTAMLTAMSPRPRNNPLNNFKPEVMTVCVILVQNRFGQQD